MHVALACRALLSACCTLQQFTPWVCGQGALLQLFLAVGCPAPETVYHRETLIMEDGGSVALDWSDEPHVNGTAPTVVILHGVGAVHIADPAVARVASHHWLSDRNMAALRASVCVQRQRNRTSCIPVPRCYSHCSAVH